MDGCHDLALSAAFQSSESPGTACLKRMCEDRVRINIVRPRFQPVIGALLIADEGGGDSMD